MSSVRPRFRPAAPAQRRRWSAPARREAIVEAAATLFADHGFAASTREIARALKLSQPLLYRHFASKAALVDAVLETVLADRWRAEWSVWLADESAPLVDRLVRFYVAYAGSASPVRLRLWMQANLAGIDVSKRFSFPLTERLLKPIAAGLRREAGLPGFAASPMTRGERELAMMLHGGIVFIGIRRHVYRMPLPDDIETLIGLHVRSFVAGAVPELRRMHGEDAAPTLTVKMLR